MNWLLARLGIAVFLSMSVMMFSVFGYRQEIAAGQGVSATELTTQLGSLMQYLSLLFATPVFLLLGAPIFSHATGLSRYRYAPTDALVLLGVAAAFLYSYVSTLRGRGETYYETACGILVFVTLGRWLEARGRLRASDAISALERLLPDTVTVQRDGHTVEIAPREVCRGDILTVHAGERICADGRIESGAAAIDERIVTGESAAIEKRAGDLVRAGTLNLDGTLRIRATADGGLSTIARLSALLDAAKNSRGRYQRLSERVAAFFLPITIAAAIVASVLGYLRSGADEAILSPLAVLLIACPCALGIATPAAIAVALGAAARRRIIIRDAETLERLSGIRAVCFDKTGTLTSAEARLVEFSACDASDPELLQRSANVAACSRHALPTALVQHAYRAGITPKPSEGVRTIPGRGLIAGAEKNRIAIGSVALMHDLDFGFNETCRTYIQRHEACGHSIMLVGWDERVRGVFAFDESLRDGARVTIRELTGMGVAPLVLTGDHEHRGRRVAEALNCTVHAGLLPEDKVHHVREIRTSIGPVAVVGDGLNDAPALAAADVGIAMGCGADVARDSAAVCLAGDELESIPWLLGLGHRTVRVIRINLLWAFAYNSVGIALAVGGKLSPLFAAGAMVANSLFVVGNSMRIGIDSVPALPKERPENKTAPISPLLEHAA